MKPVRFVVVFALMMVTVGALAAQPSKTDFPNRPLRYIVPFPPGGATDVTARIVAHGKPRLFEITDGGGLYDAATLGNLLFWRAADAAKTLNPATPPYVPANQWTITFA